MDIRSSFFIFYYKKSCFLLFMAICFSSSLFAQVLSTTTVVSESESGLLQQEGMDEKAEDNESEALKEKKDKKNKKRGYIFNILKNGDVEFKQLLEWKSLFGVLFYELTVREKESGKVVVNKLHTEKNSVQLSLPPGIYEYKVEAYNMLSHKETESAWAKIEVKRAYNPRIESVRPYILWIEDDVWDLQVYGKDFAPDCDVSFVSTGLLKRTVNIVPEQRSDKYFLFHFLQPEMFLGVPYRVKVTDKSGITQLSEQFIVKYKRPVSFYVGLGYAPIVPFGDSFYKTHWKHFMYPISFTGTLGLIFSRQSYGYFGFESKNTFRYIHLKEEETALRNTVFISTVNVVYEWWFIRSLSLYASVGVGFASNGLRFEYDGNVEGDVYFVDPTYSLGVGLRAKVHRFWYVDAIFRLEQIINKETKPLFFTPEISFGFRY